MMADPQPPPPFQQSQPFGETSQAPPPPQYQDLDRQQYPDSVNANFVSQHSPSQQAQSDTNTYQNLLDTSQASTTQPAASYPNMFASTDYANPTSSFEPSSSLNDNDTYAFRSPDSPVTKLVRGISIRYQQFLDATTPHWAARWTFSIAILILFMVRIVVSQGWYVICYGLSIYYLNLFIGFLSPKIDPAFQAGEFDLDDPSDADTGPMLPTKANDEFRPFIRRLPEFKFWVEATRATLIALVMTLFDIFDMPVFWPILLIYFLLLFITTMRQQIRHMIKYGYVPWDKGKKRYGGGGSSSKDDTNLFSPSI